MWHRGSSRGLSVRYTIDINRTHMITLRPHQERIIDRLQNYNKGQVILLEESKGETFFVIKTGEVKEVTCPVISKLSEVA